MMNLHFLARRCRFRQTGLIGPVIITGVILASIGLAPLPLAWAELDPAAASARVNASDSVDGADPTQTISPPDPSKAEAIGTPPLEALEMEAESLTLPPAPAPAPETESVPPALQMVGNQEATQVPVTIGTSVIVDVPGQIQRASVTNPQVANIQIVPPDQILVNGKAPGITTLIAWVNGKRRYYDLVVTSNLSLLQQAMKEIAPQEEIGVKAIQASVVLSGTVSNPSVIGKAAEVARAFLPEKAAVVNLLQLGEPHQIMLKVEVAEVDRTALRELGLDLINLGSTFAVALFGGTTGGVLSTTLEKDGTAVFDPRTSAILSHLPSNTRAFLRALEQKGLIKSLARPNLIAASGASASFLVGGEFPVPIVSGGGAAGTTAVTIQFKPFGVRLDFTPTLNDVGSINLKITPEVSDLDFENAVTISGFRIPSLKTRRASTIVDLKPGQSLAIGGLISSDDRKSLTKFPVLGDIPVLGALFRSTKFTRNETDLIIFVTPEIVKPLEAGQTPNLEEQMKPTPEEEKEIRQIPGREPADANK